MTKGITVIGLDLAKSFFQVHAIDAKGEVVVRRKLSRSRVIDFFSKLEPCLVGMEACATAHHWGREIRALGHEVKLMPPQFVKPYLKSQKNDMADAEAICEAVTRPTMRFVPIKTVDQQSIMVLQGVRDQLISMRIKVSNTIRGYLAEFGIVAAKGRLGLDAIVATLSDKSDDRLPDLARRCLVHLAQQLEQIKRDILEMDRKVLAVHRASRVSQRLATIPGIGPVIATRFIAEVSDPERFKSGRALSAWVGLVPRQHSSGGKDRLGRITKAGNPGLRSLLVIGAISMIRRAKMSGFTQYPWLVRLLERKPGKVAAVALANKMVRMIWALMVRDETFDPDKLVKA